MTRILLAGLPATGKTTFGNYLQRYHHFTHIDLEIFFHHKANAHRHSLAFAKAITKLILSFFQNSVITWGFVPTQHDWLVKCFQKLGYQLIWFTGNQQAIKSTFTNRSGPNLTQFNLQLKRINSTNISKYHPTIVHTINKHQNFASPKSIFNKLSKTPTPILKPTS